MESGDLRAHLQTDSPQTVLNGIMAVKFEEKFYTDTKSQSGYGRKVRVPLQMLTMPSNSAANIVNPSDQASKNQTAIKRKAASLDLMGTPNGGDWQEAYRKKIDMSNRRPTQGAIGIGFSSMDSGDWRAQLQTDVRQRIINKIMDTLNTHIPFSGDEGRLQELKKIAVRFEEKIFNAASSQSDYLRKISLKMLTRSQNPMPDAVQPNPVTNGVNPTYPASKDETAIKRKADLTARTGNPNGGDWLGFQKEIDKSNCWPTQGAIGIVGDDSMSSGDWRAQVQTDLRQRIMNKIMDTLKTHLPFSGVEGLQELKKIVVRFEEKIFNSASSQSDYLYKISLKMLTAEDIFEDFHKDFHKDAYSVNPSGPGTMVIQTVNYQAQPLAFRFPVNDTQPTQQQILPFLHNLSLTPVQASPDSTDQTGNSNRGDWKEEVYQKIKAMKDLYLQDLNNMHQKFFARLQKYDSLPHLHKKNEHIEKLKVFKNILERFMQFLLIPKRGILVSHKDKLGIYEKQIAHIINSNRPKPAPTQQEGQAPPPTHMHLVQKQSQQTLFQSKKVQDGRSSVGDWRAQMAACFRPKTVNNISDTLKKHLTLYGYQGLQEVKCIAESFEENVYTTATSQFDYEQKISLILNLESRPQNHVINA